MVIIGDQPRSRLVTGGLRTFNPGFRVFDASTLETAASWAVSEPPDLLVVGLEGLDSDLVLEWIEDHQISMDRVIVLGDEYADPRLPVVLPVDCGLSTLLEAVRRIRFDSEAEADQNVLNHGEVSV